MSMQHKNIKWLTICFALLCTTVSANAAYAETLFEPQKAIQKASDKMQKKMQDEEFKKDFKQFSLYVEETLYPYADFNRISALVLGKHWKKADKQQRAAFKKEFQILLVRTYARAFLAFKEWELRFPPIKLKPEDRKTLVKTEVLQPGKPALSVNYRMLKGKKGWKVYDIIIEGVSLVTNYRTSFKNEVKQEGSLDAVIAKMAERNALAFDVNKKKS